MALRPGAAPAALTFRPLQPGDLPLLHGWLGRPHVSAWWGAPPTPAEVEADCGPLTAAGASTTRGHLALAGARPIGFVQCYVVRGSGGGWWPDERDPGARGIDHFLADAADLGHGLGSAMVRAFVDALFDRDPAVSQVQTDPAPANLRAIRSALRAGFERVGEVVTPDGPAVLLLRRRPHAGAVDRRGTAGR